MTERALEDLRVIDISQGIAGPYATKLLADAGADVLKVEPPGGDYTRRRGPFPGGVPDAEASGLYLHLNTSKRAITLDVSVAAGHDILRRLLARADVLVTSDKTSTLASWRLTFEDLRGEFPELVFAQVSPFGATGPYADYDGNSLTAMAMSTIMYGTGDPDREPLVTGGEPAEYIAGVHLWIGILAALENRALRGGGDHVDVSMSEAAAAADEYNAAMYAFQGAVRRRYYSRHIFGYPNDIMPVADGYVVVIAGANSWPSPLAPDTVSMMALLFEDPELDKNPAFASTAERIINWRNFDALVQPYLAAHSAQEIVMTAQALRLPFAFVPDAARLLADEHLAARRFFETVAQPGVGAISVPGAPFKMTETPLYAGPAPARGSANEEVFVRELACSPADLAALSEEGVV